MKTKPTRVFLNVQPVAHRKPAGADPFTYRDTRPLRYRASWHTRDYSTELYRSKIVATREEAISLALKWLAKNNQEYIDRGLPDQVYIDTTDRPERYGYSHEPAPTAHATKKSTRQLDSEIAEVLAKPPSAAPSAVYLQTRAGQNHDLSGRRLAKLRKEFAANRGGPALTGLVGSGYVGFVGPDGELWDLEALPDYVVTGRVGGAR